MHQSWAGVHRLSKWSTGLQFPLPTQMTCIEFPNRALPDWWRFAITLTISQALPYLTCFATLTLIHTHIAAQPNGLFMSVYACVWRNRCNSCLNCVLIWWSVAGLLKMFFFRSLSLLADGWWDPPLLITQFMNRSKQGGKGPTAAAAGSKTARDAWFIKYVVARVPSDTLNGQTSVVVVHVVAKTRQFHIGDSLHKVDTYFWDFYFIIFSLHKVWLRKS